jgi:N-methylhydantoinase A
MEQMSQEARYYIGVDIGGTFTDCVVMDEAGAILQTKTSTTPDDLSEGFWVAVEEAAGLLGMPVGVLMERTRLILHGTTIGTNILVQRNGARAGLLTTRGFGDVLIVMRSAGRSAGLSIERLLRVSRHKKPAPLIPAQYIKEVTERIDRHGTIVAPLSHDDVRQSVEELISQDVEAICISFLWGFVNPEHELAARAIVGEMAPDVFVTCAHELIGKPGEYERTAATAINGYIGPATARYVSRLNTTLTDAGYERDLLIMQASGGVAPVSQVVKAPVFTIGSGPTGGVAGARLLARELGHANVITTDMGGTSFDVGLIHGGEALTASESIIDQYTMFMPRIAIQSIGAGGGSIVRVDEISGTLRVGPESAQARPGPACYGRGGTQPTVTDADMVLGYYADGALLSGGLALDAEAAREALRPIAEHVGIGLIEAAAGVKRVVDHQMAELIRQLTVGHGLDPRDFRIYAYGGAAGLHASGYARALNMREIIVPHGNLASGWSALGVLSADVLHVYERADLLTAPIDADRVNAHFRDLEARALDQLTAEGIDPARVRLARSMDMKFSLQIHEVEVEVPGGQLSGDDLVALVDRFGVRYEEIYGPGSAFPEAGVQVSLLRLRAYAQTQTPTFESWGQGTAATSEPASSRDVYWQEIRGWAPTSLFDGTRLASGTRLTGPALVEYPATMVALHPGDEASVDEFGNLTITVGEE